MNDADRPLIDVSTLPGDGWPAPVSLIGAHVRLDPLAHDDLAVLYRTMPAETFRWYSIPPPTHSEPAFVEHLDRLIVDPSRRHFAIRLASGGQVIGSSGYMDIRPAHLVLEVGYTFIAPAHRGTMVNPSIKLLMLQHAFEKLGCVRVQIKTDGRNLRSQRAIAKLGAEFEGRLRNHFIQPNGYVRDTMMYAVTRETWPAVKAGLLARVGAP